MNFEKFQVSKWASDMKRLFKVIFKNWKKCFQFEKLKCQKWFRKKVTFQGRGGGSRPTWKKFTFWFLEGFPYPHFQEKQEEGETEGKDEKEKKKRMDEEEGKGWRERVVEGLEVTGDPLVPTPLRVLHPPHPRPRPHWNLHLLCSILLQQQRCLILCSRRCLVLNVKC